MAPSLRLIGPHGADRPDRPLRPVAIRPILSLKCGKAQCTNRRRLPRRPARPAYSGRVERRRAMQRRRIRPDRRRRAGHRPGNLVSRAGSAGGGHRGAQTRPRSRPLPHRHGGTLRLRRRRGNRRRGDRRPARRGLPGLQGDAPERIAGGHDRRLRGLAQAPEDRPARLLPAALARPLRPGGHHRRLRAAQGGRQDPVLGPEQFRRGRIWRRRGRSPATGASPATRCSTIWRSAASSTR